MAARGIAKKWQQMTDAEYFEFYRSKCIVDENGCWIYQGFIGHWGYGQASLRGKSLNAHKAMYLVTKGPVPKGMDVCHTCDVRACLNPDHLWLGTRKQNADDMLAKKRHRNQVKTHCVNGHPFTPENTWINTKTLSGEPWRICRVCSRERQRRARIENPEKVRERQRRNRARRKAKLQV